MTILFFDGFDLNTSASELVKGRFAAMGPLASIRGSAYTRFGYGMCAYKAGPNIAVPAANPIVVGLAVNVDALGNGAMTLSYEPGSANYSHVSMTLDSSGAISVYRGTTSGTKLATSTNKMSPMTWYYVEIKAYIHDTEGYVIVHVDEVEWINYTGDTKGSATAGIGFVDWSSGSGHIDDLYILNTAGSAPVNDFLGNVRVFTQFPDADGENTDFAAQGYEENYQNVNSATPSDSNYNQSATAGNKDTFEYPAITSSGTIFAVQPVIMARKDDADPKTLRMQMRIDGTDYENSTDLVMTDSYAYHGVILETSPDTSIAWDLAEVNASEFGYEVES